MRLWMCASLGWLASCGGEFQRKVECDGVFTDMCEHMVECGLAYDQYLCETEQRANLQCDDRVPVEMFGQCRDALAQATCTLAIPCDCYLVLCDTTMGCADTGSVGTCDYGSGTTPSG